MACAKTAVLLNSWAVYQARQLCSLPGYEQKRNTCAVRHCKGSCFQKQAQLPSLLHMTGNGSTNPLMPASRHSREYIMRHRKDTCCWDTTKENVICKAAFASWVLPLLTARLVTANRTPSTPPCQRRVPGMLRSSVFTTPTALPCTSMDNARLQSCGATT